MYKNLRISVLLFLFIASSIRSIGQDECGHNAIRAAESNYEIGRFLECISGLKHCLDQKGFGYADKSQAYSYMAKSYLAIDSMKEADEYIKLLLAADDNFAPEAHDPERFVMEVALLKTELRASMTSSVSKRNENIEYAPATMQIITAEDIKNRGYNDLEAIFADLPGFDVTTSYGVSYSEIHMRGYRDAQYTERILVMVDGVEDNDIWSNAVFISKQYPLSNIKKVEIIYGPASTIYGANAFCGVINIITKDEQDIFPATANEKEQKAKVDVNAQGGYATYNSKYIDGTATVRTKNVLLSVTGRAYQSDGIDLSSNTNWDGGTSFSSNTYTNNLTIKYTADTFKKYHALDPTGQYFTVSADSSKIVPTAKAIARADSIDKATYKNTAAYKNANVFYVPIKDYYLSSKLSIGSFKFGMEYYDKNEGNAGDYIQNFLSPNAAYTNWEIRNFYVYSRYDRNISDHISISSLTYYRYQDYGDNSRLTSYNGYGSRALGGLSLLSNTLPTFKTTDYYQASNQFNSEFKVNYHIDDHFDVLAGTEFRTGIYQANYVTVVNAPAITSGTINPTPGGNAITEYTMSGYATASYHNSEKKINVDIGGRLDDNKFRETKGYGNMFNPRIAVVYYPGQFIFKAIYSEAFLDASNQNKFGTSTTRLDPNPTLPPEKVKNYELSARYKLTKSTYIELAGYRAYYTNSIGLANVVYNGVNTTQFQDIGKSVVYGLQAALETHITTNVSAYANFTYTDPQSIFTSSKGKDSTVRTGDIANYSANAGVNVGFFKQRLNINARVNIVSDKPTGTGTSIATNPLTSISGYELFNATVGYKVVKGVLVQVGCNNIFNSTYYSPGDRQADNKQYPAIIPQPLRNYFVKLVLDLKK